MGAVKLMWEKEAQSVLLGPWRDPVEYLLKWPKCKSPGTLGNCPLGANSKVPWGGVYLPTTLREGCTHLQKRTFHDCALPWEHATVLNLVLQAQTSALGGRFQAYHVVFFQVLLAYQL